MDRFRWGLVAIVAASLVVLGFAAAHPRPQPQPGVATSADLLPVDERSPAPDFTGIDGWINSPPLSLASLRGRVVLVDFWTYSCINCIRTIPFLQHLDATYASRGLTVVGVHSPEFEFEKDPANVRRAVLADGVTWPVALDSEMATWSAYQNQFWPAEYLLDQSGRFAYVAVGEGNDAATEDAVAALLAAPPPSSTALPTADLSGETPELYAGSNRGSLADGEAYGHPDWTFPDPGPPRQHDAIQLAGSWHDAGEYVEARAPAVVRLSFTAQNLYVVAGSAGGDLRVTVIVDGRPVTASQRGADLGAGGMTIAGARLYRVLTAQDPGHHLIELDVPAGFRLYTFTFG